MTSPQARRSPQSLLAVMLAGAVLAGCADSGAILQSADVFDLFEREEPPLPGERRPAFAETDRLAVDPEAAERPVQLPEARDIGEWSQPGGVAANAPGHLAYAGGGNSWSASVARVDSGERLTAAPIVHQGRVIVMDHAGNVTAHSLDGGGQSWSASLRPEGERDTGFGGGVAADSGVVVAATPFRQVHGIDAGSGNVAWTADLDAPARSAPTVAGGRAFVVAADNELYAIDISEGSIDWTYTGSGSAAGVLGNASPAVEGGLVIVPYSNGEIIAYDPDSGEPAWYDALSGASSFTTVSGLNDVIARPVVYDGTVYAVSVAGRMIAVSARDGERLWAQNVSSGHTPAVAGNSIFVATLAGEVVALDRSDGEVRWRTELGENGGIDLAGPLLAGGRLWLGTSDGRVITLDASDGSVGETHSIGDPVYIAPIAAGGRVLVLDNSGRLTSVN